MTNLIDIDHMAEPMLNFAEMTGLDTKTILENGSASAPISNKQRKQLLAHAKVVESHSQGKSRQYGGDTRARLKAKLAAKSSQ